MINLDISNYTGTYNHLNGQKNQMVKPLDLARAMITVGQGSWGDVFNLGIFRIGELLCKALAFCEINNGNLILQNRFYNLNQSEKVTVSYYFGQGLTKLFAESFFNIKWLFHVDDYINQIQFHSSGATIPKIRVGNTNKQAKYPDLIGLESANNSHIFEAKGSSGGYRTNIMQHAINQVSQVNTYNGVAPLTRTACYFDLSKTPIKGIIIDPKNEEKGIDIELNEKEAILKYYSFFQKNRKFFTQSFKIDNYNYMISPVGAPNIYFGFDERILDLSSTEILKEGLYPKGWVSEQKFGNTEVSLGLDGILLIKR